MLSYKHKTAIFVLCNVLIGFSLLSNNSSIVEIIREGFSFLQGEQPEKARKAFELASSMEPESGELLSYIGLTYYREKQYSASYEKFEQALQKDRNLIDASMLFYRASALRGMDLVSQERLAWKQLIRWDPESQYTSIAKEALAEPPRASRPPQKLGELAKQHWSEKRPRVAIAFLQEAIARDRTFEFPEHLVMLTTLLNECGYYESVESLLKQYKTYPQSYKNLIQFQRSVAYINQQEWEKAQTALDSISLSSHLYPYKQYMFALCQLNTGKQDEAEETLKSIDLTDLNELEKQIQTLLQSME